MRQILKLVFVSTLFFLFSCKGETPGPNDKLPNAVANIQVKQNGTSISEINFELIEQLAVGGAASGGSYLASLDMFTMTISANLTNGPTFSVTAKTGGVKTGNFDITKVTGSGNENYASLILTAASKSYQSTSGTFKITKADLYQDVVGVADYFVNVEVNITMENPADATDVVTVEGTITGVNIKAQ
ncbi:MAG: hypothetical protein R3D00_31455 [Bacteroidia bacterium]